MANIIHPPCISSDNRNSAILVFYFWLLWLYYYFFSILVFRDWLKILTINHSYLLQSFVKKWNLQIFDHVAHLDHITHTLTVRMPIHYVKHIILTQYVLCVYCILNSRIEKNSSPFIVILHWPPQQLNNGFERPAHPRTAKKDPGRFRARAVFMIYESMRRRRRRHTQRCNQLLCFRLWKFKTNVYVDIARHFTYHRRRRVDVEKYSV